MITKYINFETPYFALYVSQYIHLQLFLLQQYQTRLYLNTFDFVSILHSIMTSKLSITITKYYMAMDSLSGANLYVINISNCFNTIQNA